MTLFEDLPAVAVAVDAGTRIEALFPEATQLTEHGLVALERARLHTGDVQPVSLPEELDEATELTVYVRRQERMYQVPAFVAVCDVLHTTASPAPPHCSE